MFIVLFLSALIAGGATYDATTDGPNDPCFDRGGIVSVERDRAGSTFLCADASTVRWDDFSVRG